MIKRYLLPALPLCLILLAISFVVPLFNGKASAALNTSTSETVSDCYAGSPGVSPCQTVTILRQSYLEIYSLNTSMINVTINYTCVNGYESYSIGLAVGSNLSGPTAADTGNDCLDRPFGSTGTKNYTVYPSSANVSAGGTPAVYHAVLTLNAVNPPPGHSYYGGHLSATASVSGGSSVDIYPGASSSPGSDPGL
jgi:hypothetical protein